VLAVGYTATAADLAVAGDWSCRVFNATDADLTFDTEIVYPSTTPLEHKTATFDVGLMNLMVAEAFAAGELGFHIQSSASGTDEQSYVSWSQAVADSLPDPYKGLTRYWFQLPDYRVETDFELVSATWVVLRFSDIDSDPDAPPVGAVFSNNGVPTVRVTVALAPDRAKVTAIDSDVDVDKVGIELDVHQFSVDVELDFYGHGAKVTPHVSATAVVAGVGIDVSGAINDAITSAVSDHLGLIDAMKLGQYVSDFFRNLLRLGHQATVVSYETDSTTVSVHYTVPGSPPGPVHHLPVSVGELH
jgi:hypothetical protein